MIGEGIAPIGATESFAQISAPPKTSLLCDFWNIISLLRHQEHSLSIAQRVFPWLCTRAQHHQGSVTHLYRGPQISTHRQATAIKSAHVCLLGRSVHGNIRAC